MLAYGLCVLAAPCFAGEHRHEPSLTTSANHEIWFLSLVPDSFRLTAKQQPVIPGTGLDPQSALQFESALYCAGREASMFMEDGAANPGYLGMELLCKNPHDPVGKELLVHYYKTRSERALAENRSCDNDLCGAALTPEEVARIKQ
jgi:hypothetical protein